MIYTFKKMFVLKNGNKIKAGDSVFLDDPNEVNEITEAVESDKAKATAPKKTTKKINTLNK